MKKCFPCFFCYKKKKKIDEPVETKKIVPDVVTEPEVKRPINIQKASKPVNDGASSSNWTVSQEKGYLEQAKVVGAGAAAAAGQVKVMAAAAAQQAKDIVVGAAEQGRAIGNGAFNLLPNNIKGRFEKKNHRNDKMRAVKPQHWKEEEMRQNKIRQEKEEERRRQHDLAEEKKRQNKIRQEKEEENRRQHVLAEEKKRQNKIRQEKEEERRRQHVLAEEKKRKNKIRQEKEEENRRKQASENNSEGTSVVTVITGSFWTAMSNLTSIASTQAPGTAQPSTSTQRQRTGRASTSTQNPFLTQKETRPVEKKGKKER